MHRINLTNCSTLAKDTSTDMKKILYFSAAWCGPCRQMSAVIADTFETHPGIGDTYSLERVDVDTEPERSSRMGIRGVPTLIILNEQGQEESRKIGAFPKNKFIEWLSDYSMTTVTAPFTSADYCELKSNKGENKMLTAIKRALGLTQGDETVGSVVEWAGTRIPRYYLPCDGREYPVGQNAYVMLYSLIGTKYGGDGMKTFCVPDLRPRDSKGKLINEQYPWQDVPMKLICYQGQYPTMD
jgi:thiol-disulfide isomerase/thioredoxin